jgi:hypothetical protein
MSLAGSLDDLGLCDLLQILSLSSKSGLLSLQSPEGEGWVAFSQGQVAGASAKGGPPDLRALLRENGLDELSVPEPELLESLRREAAEAAVVRMLGWCEGDFRFDTTGAEERVRATGLRLATPIPSQYLALEGVRLNDESGAPAAEATPPSTPVPCAPTERLPHALVVIDPALGALEWLKRCLGPSFVHVHIFQSTELGVTRIRQYLARGDQPVVLLARDARPDALSGIRDATELVTRLGQQAPRMPIVLLVESDGDPAAVRNSAVRGLAGVVARPSVDRLKDPRCRAQVTAAGEALRGVLVDAVRGARRA